MAAGPRINSVASQQPTEQPQPPAQRGWSAVHVLAEPTRRAVFEAVRAARAPMTRDEVAGQVGMGRRLAAFHLDRLAEAGLLTVDFARPPGRRGPGAGRPAKRYSAVGVAVEVCVPPRRYDLAGRILAKAIATPVSGDPTADALAVAEDEGRQIGSPHAGDGLGPEETLAKASSALAELGYEPEHDESGAVRLRNCPFHAVVEVAPALVCEVNQRLVTGLVSGLRGHPCVHAVLGGAPGDCCVTLAALPDPPAATANGADEAER